MSPVVSKLRFEESLIFTKIKQKRGTHITPVKLHSAGKAQCIIFSFVSIIHSKSKLPLEVSI